MDGVELDYAVPAADLSPYVTSFYRFAAERERMDEIERADHAQFRFLLRFGDPVYHFADGSIAVPPRCHLLPAMLEPRRACGTGPMLVFGMGLTAAGWQALGGAGAVVDCGAEGMMPIDAVVRFGSVIDEAVAALVVAPDLAAMVTVAEPLLRRLIGRTDPAVLAFLAAVDGWLAGAASPAIDDLAAITGLSRRQVERRCNALFGAPPKLLARKYRALRAATALVRGAATVDQLIADGFYDQSHLIREVKQFTGMTPRRLRADRPQLTHLTIDGRTALRGRVGPLVSDT